MNSKTKLNLSIRRGDYLKGKTVLLTGLGSIGQELYKQILSHKPSKIVLFDRSQSQLDTLATKAKKVEVEKVQGDITNKTLLEQLFKNHKIDIVFHTAAEKHVPLMEGNPKKAFVTNVLGTKYLSLLSLEYMVEDFIHISTDKAVNPSSVMGATKRINELWLQSLTKKGETHFKIVRFGNVYGSSGSVVPIFEKQLDENKNLTLTSTETTRYFMSVEEAVSLTISARNIGDSGDIVVLDMGEPIKILDLAKNIMREKGRVPNGLEGIDIIGMRPGEKLHEELVYKSSEIETFENFIIEKNVYTDNEILINQINEIKNMNSASSIKRAFKEIIPTYSPTSSY